MALFRMKPHYRKRGGGTLSYYMTIPNDFAYYHDAGASTLNYAWFAGGVDTQSTPHTMLKVYDKSLTSSAPNGLSVARSNAAAAATKTRVIFYGGSQYLGSSSWSYPSISDSFDEQFTRTAVYSEQRQDAVGAAIGNYILFGCGVQYTGSDNSYSSGVDAYDASLTRSRPTGTSCIGSDSSATATDNYLMFAGGYTYRKSDKRRYYYQTASVYNTSLIKLSDCYLSSKKYRLAAVTIGEYMLFGGGGTGDGNTAVVDVFDSSLTKIQVANFFVARSGYQGVSVKDFAIFTSGPANNNVLDVYDKTLVHSSDLSLSETDKTYNLSAAAAVDKYALFRAAQSNGYGGMFATVDVFQVT